MIVGAIAVLTAVGTASIYVTDTHYVADHDGPANAARQLMIMALSLVAAGVVLHFGYHRIARHAYLIFAISLLTLIPLVVAKLLHSDLGGLTPQRNGAYRWIRLPVMQVQPSEFMKLAYILALAWYLRYRDNFRRFSGLLLPFVVSAIPLALILLEPDLGTALLLVPVLFTMIFIAGAKLRHLALIVLIGVITVPLAWGKLQDYQRLRITALLLQSPTLREKVIESDDDSFYRRLASKREAAEWAGSSGYQLVHSKNALGSGGLTGYGWGKGNYVQHGQLPDRHNDFIFSVIGHQWGLLGCLLVLGCYMVIVLSGARIAAMTTEPLARLLAVGMVTLIATQVLINVYMTVGLMPITGMTLPFVSYGGSSLLANFLAAALLLSVAKHRPYLLAMRPFNFRIRKRKVLPSELERGLSPQEVLEPLSSVCETDKSAMPSKSRSSRKRRRARSSG